MSLSVDLGPEEIALQDSMSRFCQRRLGAEIHTRAASRFTRPLWRDFAETGLLDVAGTRDASSVLYACLGLEILGYFGFPGPIPHTIALSRSLNERDWK